MKTKLKSRMASKPSPCKGAPGNQTPQSSNISQPEKKMKHHIQVATSAYNARRYSKPWIAVVNFGRTPDGDFAWGAWVGDARNGTAGVLEIEAETGAIVATGQKDFRDPRSSAPDWYQVSAEGKLLPLSTKADALRAFRDAEDVKRAEDLAAPDRSNALDLAVDALQHAIAVATDNNQPRRKAHLDRLLSELRLSPND